MKYLIEQLPMVGCLSIILETDNAIAIDFVGQTELTIKITNDGEFIKIPYPEKIEVLNKEINLIKGTDGEYYMRLKYKVVSDNGSSAKTLDMLVDESEWIWTKKELELTQVYEFRCNHCSNCVFSNKTNCTKLNSMPSEFWMELMDYWHCHKPNVKDMGGDEAYATKYNSLQPNKYEVLVGSSSFQSIPDTFEGTITIQEKNVHCKQCDAVIGEYTNEKLCTIFKWCLQNQFGEKYPSAQHVLSSILNSINSTSTRYILLKTGKSKHIFLWVFSVGINISTSNNFIITNSMKILYKNNVDDSVTSTRNVEEILVTEETYDSFKELLISMNEKLPVKIRTMKDWDVAYIPTKILS